MSFGVIIIIIWIVVAALNSGNEKTEAPPSTGDAYATSLVAGVVYVVAILSFTGFVTAIIEHAIASTIAFGLSTLTIYAGSLFFLFKSWPDKTNNLNRGHGTGLFTAGLAGFIFSFGFFYNGLQDLTGYLTFNESSSGVKLSFLYFWDAILPVGRSNNLVPSQSPAPANLWGKITIYSYMLAVQIACALFLVRVFHRKPIKTL